MSEVRLIDANALISKMVNEPVKAVDGVDFDAEWFTRIADTAVQFTDMVENAPTVDAVPEVVRCKECVKRPPTTARNGDEPTSDCPLWCGYCFGIDDSHGGEFFCADGERR